MAKPELQAAAERRRLTPYRDIPVGERGAFSSADNRQRIEDAALLADAYLAVAPVALRLCRTLQAPAIEYLPGEVQAAWSELFDLLEPKPLLTNPTE